MTSFNKIKFKYLIQVWENVMKIIRNAKNVNVEKIRWWRHYLNIPHSHLGYPSPSLPVMSFLNHPLRRCETIIRINWKH